MYSVLFYFVIFINLFLVLHYHQRYNMYHLYSDTLFKRNLIHYIISSY
jgi:hypothetical protein